MNNWLILVLFSAIFLGIYDITRKHAVRNNSAICVLLLASIAGAIAFTFYTLVTGNFISALSCSSKEFLLVFLKACIVGGSWGCVYTAMRKLPISLAAPIRSTAPLWTFIAAIFIYGEIPSLISGIGMAVIFIGYYALSVIGQLEGFSFKNKSMLLIVAGTILGSAAAIYDKYLLNQLELSPIHYADYGFIPKNSDGIGTLAEHHAGMIYVQDPGAMATVTALEAERGWRVLDACSAPGGKA